MARRLCRLVCRRACRTQQVPEYTDEEIVAHTEDVKQACCVRELNEIKNSCFCCCQSRSVGSQDKLKRVFGCAELTTLGVGMIMGTAGTFVLPGLAVQQAGPGVVFSYAICAVAALLIQVCFAELAAAIPSTGAAYSYTYVYFGEFCAAFVGWNQILYSVAGSAANGRAWTVYGVALFREANIQVPLWLYQINIPGTTLFSLNLAAMGMVVAISLVVIWGVKQSSLINSVLLVIKLSVLCFFIVHCFTKFQLSHFSPLLPEGITGVFKGANTLLFAFIGADGLCSLAGEVRQPRKVLPAALLGSTVIASVFYNLVGWSLVGGAAYKAISPSEPLVSVMSSAFGKAIISTAALLFAPIIVLTGAISLSRVMIRVSKDGLLPPFVAKIQRHQPVNAVLIYMFVTVLLCNFDIAVLANLSLNGSLLSYIFVFAAVIHRRHPSGRSTGHSPCSGDAWLINAALVLVLVLSAMFSWSFYRNVQVGQIAFSILLSLTIIIFSTVSFCAQLRRPRMSTPANKRLFRVPLVPLIPLIGLCFIEHLFAGSGVHSHIGVSVWNVIGIVIYFGSSACWARERLLNDHDHAGSEHERKSLLPDIKTN